MSCVSTEGWDRGISLRTLPLLLAGMGLLCVAPLQAAEQPLAQRAGAILQQHCAECHGGRLTRGGLSILSRDSLLKGGSSGPVVDLQDVTSSHLWRLITHQDKPEMPYRRPKLSDEELAVVKEWLQAGARYQGDLTAPPQDDWWSLRPLLLPAIPAAPAEFSSWPRNAIDHFVLAKLREKGLSPSAEADRRIWLRRVSIDLLGLPPTPEELQAFVDDASEQAYEHVVDRLLASPQYGERWARHWLDVVHFAETHGHDQDRPRPNAWPYRDYLIQSFNADKPYARFAQEQLAGDILWPEDPQGIVALGFLAAGPWDESSLRDIRDDTIDRQIARYLDRDDVVTNVSATFLSTTVQCARCHDHKFDPIQQTDYYRLQAVFSGVDKSDRAYDPDPAIGRRRAALQDRLQALPGLGEQAADELLTAAVQEQVAHWEADVAATANVWSVLEFSEVKAEHGSTLTKQSDGSYLASGDRPEKEIYTFVATLPPGKVTGLKLEVLTDASLPHQGPGRQDNGNLHLNELKVTLAPADQPTQARDLKLMQPMADFNQQGWSIEMALDGNPGTAWGIYPQVGQSHAAAFAFAEPVELATAGVLTIRLEQIHGGGHLIGRPRLSVTKLPAPLPLDNLVLPAQIQANLQIPADQRTPQQQAQLAAHVLAHLAQQELAQLPPLQKVYCASNDFEPDGSFRASPTPRPVHVLRRGDVLKPEAEVGPGTLNCVPGLPAVFDIKNPQDEGERRVAFAHWATHRENGLFWRSIINRVWHYHFGRGLVDTQNDFGRMGAQPTHPELLEWLAVSFRDAGGNLKPLHRQIVLSATYRQSSRAPAVDDPRHAALKLDADNRLLWRMNSQRMDAETIRDATLLIAGKLDRTQGGPSVKQFIQSPGIHVTPNVDYLNFDVDQPENYRRSVYRFLFRTLPDPFMETLDCADGSQSTPSRNTSLTALQALTMWNNKLMVRLAEHLAARCEQQAPELPGQVQYLTRQVWLRDPTPAEATALADYAREFGLANLCRVVLNSNEFVFVE